jgi:hypothetical protein
MNFVVEAWIAQRPDKGKGWTPWKNGRGELTIEST